MARSDVYEDIYTGESLLISTTLDRYQEIYRLPEYAFNGLYNPDDELYDCPTIWQQTDRDNLFENLRLAQEMRETELGFPLAPTYFSEEYEYKPNLILGKKHISKIGLRTVTDIDTVTLTLTDDPVVITVAVTFTDPSEVRIFYPGESVEIKPKKVRISGGNAEITIPRARLVDPVYNVNWDPDSNEIQVHRFDNLDLYLTEVDVKRIHYAENGGIQFVWNPGNCSSETEEVTQTAKGLITNRKLAIVQTTPSVWTSETAFTYSRRFTGCRTPDLIRINYVAGHSAARSDQITARLSHIQPNAMSPCEVCWRDDVLPHPNRTMTPYGYTVAAVDAWFADARFRIGHGGMVKKR